MDWLTLLPITAIVAVIVFLFREMLEHFRRKSSDQRKVKSLTRLLARECELNLWTIKSLRRIVSEVHRDEKPNLGVTVSVQRTTSGRPFAQISSDDGGLISQIPIPRVHRELMSKFLLDVATLDQALFEVMEPAYDSVGELEHVSESLVNIHDAPEDIGLESFLEGFAGYAINELNEIESNLGKLYMHCTGKKLEQHRLR